MDVDDFGAALRKAREAAGLTQASVARHLGKTALSVHRWEMQGVRPTYEDRVALLQLLAKAPRALLAELAEESDVALDSVLPLPPAPPAPPPAAAAPPLPARVMLENAQTVVDDAVREAAEDLDVTPRALRPILSRLIDRAARAGVPLDAAARMVLGVPKKEPEEKKKPATTA
jgi:transcriptional regulator with XRE-family HTH domain